MDTVPPPDGKNFVVVGASSGIGHAIARELCLVPSSQRVLATYRSTSDMALVHSLRDEFPNKVRLHKLDASCEEDYATLSSALGDHPLDGCINAIGVLHDESAKIFPERKIDEFEPDKFLQVIQVNVTPTLLLAKVLKDSIRDSEAPFFVSISAKVGSIADNKMGGWHSYRISKAALNMAVKNISLEFQRMNRRSSVLAIHPGTTDTKLSAPFMEGAKKKYKIHSPTETAQNILKVIEQAQTNQSTGQFYSWDGEVLPW